MAQKASIYLANLSKTTDVSKMNVTALGGPYSHLFLL